MVWKAGGASPLSESAMACTSKPRKSVLVTIMRLQTLSK